MDGPDDRDPLEGLEDRLQSHAKAFESLLALTPAQDYYGSQIVDGKDPSEQWNRKKQTKEQKRAAKKAKLDPANQKSALDVMKEREAEAMKRKRKRDAEEGVESEEDGEDEDEAEPAQATKRKKGEEDADAAEAKRRAKAEKRKEKRQQKKEKLEHKKEKAEAKKVAKQDRDLEEAQAEKQTLEAEGSDDDDEPASAEKDADLEAMDLSGLAEPEVANVMDADEAASEGSSAPSTPALDSPAFDVSTNHSAASSSSSIIPPEEEDDSTKAPPKTKKAPPQKPTVDTKAVSTHPQPSSSKSIDPPSGVSSPKIQLPDIDHDELQARVRKRIEELRAARKADGPEGKPARSRQELLEQRRKKGEQKKAAKKAQRQKQKEEEAQKREAQLRGSGSPLSADIFSPRSPRPQENNYSFSRLAFDDGTSADPSMTSLRDPKKTKGPSDPRTALQAAQNKQSRIAGYDPTKRAEIGEKDMWLHARQRAQGERVKDDTNLLKKALKRKEKQKNKSEKQWQEREQAVVKGKEMKQKKREANLAKRKEDKGGGGKKKGKASGGKGGSAGAGGGKKKGRPGFEGRFKA